MIHLNNGSHSKKGNGYEEKKDDAANADRYIEKENGYFAKEDHNPGKKDV